MYEDVASVTDQLRSIKSQIEGTSVGYQKTEIRENVLPELHRMIQQTIPDYLLDHKEEIFSRVQNSFKGMVMSLGI